MGCNSLDRSAWEAVMKGWNALLQGWNRLTVELMTHARDGLTQNDFIMAAKLNAVDKEDLPSERRRAS